MKVHLQTSYAWTIFGIFFYNNGDINIYVTTCHMHVILDKRWLQEQYNQLWLLENIKIMVTSMQNVINYGYILKQSWI